MSFIISKNEQIILSDSNKKLKKDLILHLVKKKVYYVTVLYNMMSSWTKSAKKSYGPNELLNDVTNQYLPLF